MAKSEESGENFVTRSERRSPPFLLDLPAALVGGGGDGGSDFGKGGIYSIL